MRLLLLLPLFSCLSCVAQLGVEQPIFSLQSVSSAVPTAGIITWHKPETITGAENSRLAMWEDSSGSGHHVYTNNSGGGIITNNLLDGYPALWFGGSGTFGYYYQTNNGGIQMLRDVEGITLYAVLRQPTDSGYKFWFSFTQGDQLNAVRFDVGNNGTLKVVDASGPDSEAVRTIDGFTLASSTWYLWTIQMTWTNNSIAVYTNGVFRYGQTNWLVSSSKTSNTDSLRATLGWDGASGWKGELMEVLLYKVPQSTAIRRSIETNYFKPKYPSLNIQ